MVTVVLPVFDEASALPDVLHDVHRALAALGCAHEIVVVDDGSRDGSFEIARAAARQMPVATVRHDRNRGLGAALRSGFRAALERCGSAGVVVTMDADGTHCTSTLAALIDEIALGADLAIASRYVPGARVTGVPRFRRGLSLGASLWVRALAPRLGARDVTSGLRAYRAPLLRRLLVRLEDRLGTQGFECSVALLLAAMHEEAVVREVPIALRYERKRSPSKLRPARTAWACMRTALDSPPARP